jgi:iron complex outermembrane recepter protein
MTCISSRLRATFLMSTCFLASPSYAQEQHQPLPALDVTTAADDPAAIVDLPLSGQTLERERIRRRSRDTSDTAAILSELPGVSLSSGGGFSSMPMVRGLTEQRLTILVDGVVIDLACPNDMNSPLSYTDPQTVASIRVLPGIAPVSMGGDNIGGVISVDRAPPAFASGSTLLTRGEASSFYRSNGDGFGGGLTATVATSSLAMTYSASYARSGRYEAGGDRGLVRSTEFAKTDHQLSLAHQGSIGLLELRGGIHRSPHEGFPNQYMDMTSNKSWFLAGRWQQIFDFGKLQASLDYRDTDHRMNFLKDKGGTANGGMPMNTEVHSFSAQLKGEFSLSMHDMLRSGVEYHDQWLDDYWPPVAGSMMMGPDSFVNVNGATRLRTAIFAEWERHWSDSFSTLGGLRYERVAMNTGDVQPYGSGMMQMDDVMAAAAFNARDHRRRDHNLNGSIIAVLSLSKLISVEAGLARKVRSPNIYERYSWGRGSMASRMIGWYGDGNGYVGNLDLDPERANSVSLALKLRDPGGNWSLSVSPYYTHVHDYIDARFIKAFTDMMGRPTGFNQLMFVNRDARFAGIDISGDVRLWKGDGEDGTVLRATMAHVRANNLADDLPIYRQPPLNGRLEIEHRQGNLDAGVSLDWSSDKRRVDPQRAEPGTKGYVLVNASAGYRVGKTRLSLGVENLFDKAYDLPLGGMSLGDYKADGIRRPVPGRGRSINLGLTTEF